MKLFVITCVLFLVGCGNSVNLEKFENVKMRPDVLTIQLYSALKNDNNRILHITMFESGPIIVEVHGVKMKINNEMVNNPKYKQRYDEILQVAEHWMLEGNMYAKENKDESELKLSVNIDLSIMHGTNRSIRVPVSQENFDKLKNGLIERLKGYYSTP